MLSHLLPKTDPRFIKWRESLKKRPPPWSKGFTKETHPGLAKLSNTFKKNKIDNFKKWREEAKRKGLIKTHYPFLKESGDLAELIGVILGDGHIQKFPRTEGLTVAANSNNTGFIKRYSDLIEKLFDKKPYIKKQIISNCTRIRIYQKYISKRLNIPTGNRSKFKAKTPKWIWQNKGLLIRFLRGLYEAEGSFCVHKPTSTYKFLFSNRNPYLLNIVYRGLVKLGFSPHRSPDKIQLSKKEQVCRCKDLVQFRIY